MGLDCDPVPKPQDMRWKIPELTFQGMRRFQFSVQIYKNILQVDLPYGKLRRDMRSVELTNFLRVTSDLPNAYTQFRFISVFNDRD